MKLPEEFLASLEGVPGFNREAFVAVHEEEETVTSIRLNPAKPMVTDLPMPGVTSDYSHAASPLSMPRTPVPWSRYGWYLAKRPSFTFDPLFHAGCYYVQEASSMFLEQALVHLAPLAQPLKVLDLCAAPGGKSTHLQSLLHPESLLVSNEVIRQRSVVLTDNVIKWGCPNVVVTNNDPKAFQKLAGYFDVMVVDAPCSGSGLFRKDADAIDEWSLNNVALCSQRQQRILADALPALKAGGLLVYSTCSYSIAEDEEIMEWLVAEMGMESVPLTLQNDWQIVPAATQSGAIGYRFYPDKVQGEGFFLAAFQKSGSVGDGRLKAAKPVPVSAKEKTIAEKWLKKVDAGLYYFRNDIMALPQHLVPEFGILQQYLHIQYAGVLMGQVMKEKLVPHHALAQSIWLSPDVPALALSYEEAILYLQRNDLALAPETTGWQVVQYGAQNLGWINALKNRVNNYYPKEIRILKQNNRTF